MSILAPYITGGVTENWTDYLKAAEQAGADQIELGLPFSDPTLDGPVVQRASEQALRRGASASMILAELDNLDLSIPVYVMTYANLAFRYRFDNVAGLIVPDLPVDEADQLDQDVVLLASPATPNHRLKQIAKRSKGFVYAVSLMGTTGEQKHLNDTETLVTELKRHTDLPVLVGFGISTKQHVTQACRYADGVLVGSAVMRRVLDGATPEEIGAFLARLRS